MGLINLLRYKFSKRRVVVRQKLYPDYVPTDKEQKVISIIKSLIKDENSKMMVAPNSGKLYIKNTSKGIFIVIDDVYITLLNNKTMSYHDIIVKSPVSDKLKQYFKNVLESKISLMESEMLNSVVNNLDYISKHINDLEYESTATNRK